MIKHQVFENHQVRGWLGRFNSTHNYTQLWYLNDLYGLIQESYFNMLNVEKSIREALEPIYQNSTIDEWLYEYVDPVLERLVRYLDDIDRLKKERAFPRRNFKILRNIRAIRRQ
ncbi:hypothetical protein Tcan_16898 [Toxocara canis]|uniref:Uncharacterized protein n=1 Tax=Toxocara canis TaxID=6265 RepID=A0A0B2W2H3_TOXCA|nr:hypothetical protein Tcan_16898 [Toxocara canis]